MPKPEAPAFLSSSISSSFIPPETMIPTSFFPLRSSSHLTSLTMSGKLPRLEDGVSSLTALSPFMVSAALIDDSFSSPYVSTSAILGVPFSVTSSYSFHPLSSPSNNRRECGIVPSAFFDILSAPIMLDTLSQPPMYEFLSIRGARAGCILRTPNERRGRSPILFLKNDAFVAMPDACDSDPSMGVSSIPKSRYFPATFTAGIGIPLMSLGGKIVPSGREYKSTSAPSIRPVRSSRPERVIQRSSLEEHVISMTTLGLKPIFFKTSLALIK